MKNLPIKSESFQYVEKSFAAWLDILGYAHQTVYQLPVYCRELFYWLETEKKITQLNQITTPLIKEYYDYLKHRTNTKTKGGLSNGYLNKQLQGLYKLMEYLRKSGKLKLPYLEISREESNPKGIEIITIQEISALYKATEPQINTPRWEAIAARDKVMLAILYGCGLRRTEAVSLDLSDVNFDKQIIHVRRGKNYKERFVPFSKNTSKILQDYIYDFRPYFLNAKQLNALFLSVKGYRIDGQSLAIRLKLLIQKTDDIELQQKDISLHTLRHSIATHLLSAGMNLENISKFLGHSSLESTQIYTHLIKGNGEDI